MGLYSSQQIDTKPIFILSPTASVIIPAYNEERRISSVINVVRDTAFISEIIIVDDGSRDRTGEIAREAASIDSRIKLVSHPTNLGKGQAVFSGARICRNSIIITLDADLVGLTAEHIFNLVKPVMESKTDMSLGIFRGGKLASDLSHWATPWLTGQRCFRLSMLRYINMDAAAGYGFETAMTVAAKQQDWRCQQIFWRGVSHPPSEFHRGRLRGIVTRAKMYTQILRAWYIANSKHWIGKHLRIPMEFHL
ncbi:MAG: glycosyltransferase family 2 protein [Chloroflexi bacterium]|nr:glycosyltransferase family 2 protein [Chloroflexota bacterium]